MKKKKKLAAAAGLLTFLRFFLNYISSEVRMLRRELEFLSVEMDLEAAVVFWMARGIRADLQFPAGWMGDPWRQAERWTPCGAGRGLIYLTPFEGLLQSRGEGLNHTLMAWPCRGLIVALSLHTNTLLKFCSIFHFGFSGHV